MTSALATMLENNSQFATADLYTITLYDGTVLYYSSADIDLTINGITFPATGPTFTRNTTSQKIGVQVDTLSITAAPGPSDLIKGVPWLSFLRAGGLDGATIELDKYIGQSLGDPNAGMLIWFIGQVAEVDVTRTEAVVKISSMVQELSIMLPKNVYQQGCVHTLFDGGCTLVKSAYTVSGTVTAGSTDQLVLANTFAQANDYFDLGVLTFTSGANNGLTRVVGTYITGTTAQFNIVEPLPEAPAAGDTFTVYPGCDKQLSTCENKYNNKPNFRGYPFIPVPETIY